MPDSTGRNRSVRPWGNMEAVSHVMSTAPVGGTDRLVLMAIAHQSETEGPEIAGSENNSWGRRLLPRGSADPSVQTLAALTRLSTRTVQRSVLKLVEAGELYIEPNAGMAKANLYAMPRLATAPFPLVVDPGVNLQAMHCVILFSEASANDLLVQIAIARFVNSHGSRKGSAFPSVKALASLTGLADRTVSEAVDALVAVGELVVDRRAARYGNNRYTIPMLQQGGVRSTRELPRYLMLLSNEEVDTKTTTTSTKGSSHSKVTPGEVYRVQAEIAVRLADALIAAERKDPDFRTDAVSDEWRSGAARLMFSLNFGVETWFDDPTTFLDDLFRHVIESDKWVHIQSPRDVDDLLDEILADITSGSDSFTSEGPRDCSTPVSDWDPTGTDLCVTAASKRRRGIHT